MEIDKKTELFRFIRFCAVGLLNTLVTFLVFTILRYFEVNIYLSNILSYVAGMVNSFFWNKKWVYKSSSRKWLKEAALFLLFFGICYLAQLQVFRLSLSFFPQWLAGTGFLSDGTSRLPVSLSELLRDNLGEWISQICGMAVYSIFNFILNRIFTFNEKD